MMTTTETPNSQERFAMVKRCLGAIPAFGDTIGDKVSKPQLAIAFNAVCALEEEHEKLRSDLFDAYERLSRHLPYYHDVLVNMRSALNLPHY